MPGRILTLAGPPASRMIPMTARMSSERTEGMAIRTSSTVLVLRRAGISCRVPRTLMPWILMPSFERIVVDEADREILRSLADQHVPGDRAAGVARPDDEDAQAALRHSLRLAQVLDDGPFGDPQDADRAQREQVVDQNHGPGQGREIRRGLDEQVPSPSTADGTVIALKSLRRSLSPKNRQDTSYMLWTRRMVSFTPARWRCRT